MDKSTGNRLEKYYESKATTVQTNSILRDTSSETIHKKLRKSFFIAGNLSQLEVEVTIDAVSVKEVDSGFTRYRIESVSNPSHDLIHSEFGNLNNKNQTVNKETEVVYVNSSGAFETNSSMARRFGIKRQTLKKLGLDVSGTYVNWTAVKAYSYTVTLYATSW